MTCALSSTSLGRDSDVSVAESLKQLQHLYLVRCYITAAAVSLSSFWKCQSQGGWGTL